jgi:hypothetical protein
MKAIVDTEESQIAKRHDLGLRKEPLPDTSVHAPYEWLSSPTQTVIGELIGLRDDGCTALVLFAGQRGTAAVSARTVVSLYGRHIGNQVMLAFDAGDVSKPVVLGLIRSPNGSALTPEVRHAEVEADGERLIVTAREQLVLRCGSASITLTKEGKVLIEGSFVSTRSTGVNRIRGGSVQIN